MSRMPEEGLDIELELMGSDAHMRHFKLGPDSYYKVVTVATPHNISYPDAFKVLATIFNDLQASGRSDRGTFIIDSFAECGWGVALCHHLDQFNRKRGRIIAKGRLLKVLDTRGVTRCI